MQKKRIVRFIFIYLFIFTFTIGNGFGQVKEEIEKREIWSEIRFNFGKIHPHYFRWCVSNKKIVFVGGGEKGISLLDIESGKIEQLTTDPRHQNPACSPYGRYILFTDIHNPGNYKNLFSYDLKTKKVNNVYSLDKPLPVHDIYDPISPSGKYIIGPPNWKKKITLPGGEEIGVVPIHITSENVKLMSLFGIRKIPRL